MVKKPKEKSRFAEWCQITSCHGLADWERSKNLFKKIVWSILILVAISILAAFLIELIVSYCQNDKWTTNIYETSTNARVPKTPFLTICNYNRIQKGLVEKYGLDPKFVPVIYAPLLPFEYPIAKLNYSREIKNNLTQWMKVNKMTTEDIFMNLTQSCEDLFVLAKLGLKVMTGKEICQTPAVKKILHVEFGACFQLNGPLIAEQNSIGGKSSVLSLFLNASISETLAVVENNFLEEGFAFQFDYSPFVRSSRWINVPLGFRSRIGIQTQRTTLSKSSMLDPLLFEPPCEEKPNLKIYSNDYFSLDLCNIDCYQQEVIQSCGCINVVETNKYPLCQTVQLIDCILKWQSEDDSFKNLAECSSKCKEPCSDETIESKVSMTKFSQFAQRALISILYPSINQTLLENISLAAVDMYFETTKIKVVNYYQVVTASNLISNIGGQLGLWAGISTLTIIQCFMHFCFPGEDKDDENT